MPSERMNLTLHHLNASRSTRIVWLLEELREANGLEFSVKSWSRDAATNLAPPGLAEVHPLGKAPVLEDGPFVIAESGAIAQYLLAHHDHGHALHPRPSDVSYPGFVEWMHAAEGAVFLPGLMGFYLARAGLGDSGLAQYMASERNKAVAHVERRLTSHRFFAGERFTAADCMMGFMLDNPGMPQLPGIGRWRAEVSARPAFVRARQAG